MNSTDQTILTINSQNEQDKDVKMLRTDSLLERFKNLFVTVIENDGMRYFYNYILIKKKDD